MSRIRIVSKGTGSTTHVYDGYKHEIKGITSITLHIHPGGPTKAVMVLDGPLIDIQADVAKVKVKRPHMSRYYVRGAIKH